MNTVLPVGKTIYKQTHNDMCIQGISYNAIDLKQSIKIVANTCFDTLEQNKFEDYMLSLSDTGFDPITTVIPNIRDWQVGEGFAEAYLTAHFSCNFPWSNKRDQKNYESSLTGADLVGFHKHQFAFGETKTSREKQHPPQVTSKLKDGLNTQLKKLCHDSDGRWTLIHYLFYREKNTTKYKEACKAYLKDSKDFYVFGVLVRDTDPKIEDWNYLKGHLKSHAPDKVSLVALYLPQKDGITKLHTGVLSNGGNS